MVHGDFEQTPASHCKYNGPRGSCPKRGNMKKSEMLSLTNEEFIEKWKQLHGDIYDYSKVKYVKY